MGLISTLVRTLFGGEQNVVRDVAEVFRENSEAAGRRAHDLDTAALQQLSSEFAHARKGRFDRMVDGLNRLPRPMMVMAVFGLLIYTPINPLLMAEVFTAWALIPPGLWAILGIIVTFYFGGRQQAKSLDLQRDMAQTAARAPAVIANIKAIRQMRYDSPGVADVDRAPQSRDPNVPLNEIMADMR